MQAITNEKQGKRFFLDGNRAVEVVLKEVRADGYAVVTFSDGTFGPVGIPRLTEIIEIPQPQLSEEAINIEYPQKANKVTIEIYDAETGDTVVKWLDGAEALKWNQWMRELCSRAEQVGMNPPWMKLKWKYSRKQKEK